MHIRRGLLFGGLFFITVGAIELLVRAGTIDANRLDEAWKLWPLILVGLGIAILLGRSRVAVVGTIIAAITVGAIVGGAIASGGGWIATITDCGGNQPTDQTTSEAGGFSGPSTIDLSIRCGTLTFGTDSGSGWTFGAAYRGPEPILEGTANTLDIKVPEGTGVRRQDWTITAGTQTLSELKVQANAASGTIALSGAKLAGFDLQTNAGDVIVDGTGASIHGLEVQVNAARARITLDVDTSGELQVNAGSIELCLPKDASVQLDVADQITFATNLAESGLNHSGTTWTRAGLASGAPIDLHIEGNAASLTLDPVGGCR